MANPSADSRRQGSGLARCVLLVFFLIAALPVATQARTNQLAGNPSPYLAMHGKDPVHWQVWNRSVLEQARRENRLVLISSGYFSCHWCHVMQRESYRDSGIAQRLNNGFIAVKVDRELLPALDRQLIDFVQATRGSAGWPLNVFVTPDGYPLVGFTYMPRDRFGDFLDRLVTRWKSETEELRALAKSQVESSQDLPAARNQFLLDPVQFQEYLLKSTWQYADELSGGFGQQTKFPMAPQLLVLLEVARSRPDKRLADFLRLTLDAMLDGGLRDHIGGGFFRYSTDPHWGLPHFEKMLYDNALLAQVYLRAADVLNSRRYRDAAFETLDFLIREMWTQDHAFVASFSAVDAQNVEGGYYLWGKQQLKSLLSDDQWKVARLAWGFDHPPVAEHGYLPTAARSTKEVADMLGLGPVQVQQLLVEARDRLSSARKKRALPVDDKLIAGWNALALQSLTIAMKTPGGARFRKTARALRATLIERFWQQSRLRRAMVGDKELGQAALADYAYVAQALQNFDADDPVVRSIVEKGWKLFYRNGRWMTGIPTGLAIDQGARVVDDSVLPSAAATLLRVSRMVKYPGKREAFDAISGSRPDGLLWRASYLFTLERKSGVR